MNTATAPITTDRVWSLLATILDPEFGLSIVDLGLIYDVAIDGSDVSVAMTFTSRSCPAGEMMLGGVENVLRSLPGVGAVRVRVVWEPAWTPALLPPAAREHLG